MVKKITIIAEAGVNYNGDIRIAKEMVKAAAASGADYVKFQTGVPKFDVSVFAEKAPRQMNRVSCKNRPGRIFHPVPETKKPPGKPGGHQRRSA